MVAIHPDDAQRAPCPLNVLHVKGQPLWKFRPQFPPPCLAGARALVDGTGTRRGTAGLQVWAWAGLEEPPLPPLFDHRTPPCWPSFRVKENKLTMSISLGGAIRPSLPRTLHELHHLFTHELFPAARVPAEAMKLLQMEGSRVANCSWGERQELGWLGYCCL